MDGKPMLDYPTKEHRKGIKLLGSTEHHRMSFQLLPSQLSLFEEV